MGCMGSCTSRFQMSAEKLRALPVDKALSTCIEFAGFVAEEWVSNNPTASGWFESAKCSLFLMNINKEWQTFPRESVIFDPIRCGGHEGSSAGRCISLAYDAAISALHARDCDNELSRNAFEKCARDEIEGSVYFGTEIHLPVVLGKVNPIRDFNSVFEGFLEKALMR